jgi:hypothetical protein
MAQALIFSSPDVTRASASNLWMRRAQFRTENALNEAGVASSTLEIVGERSFDRGSSGTLHSVDVECQDFFGITAAASLAYTVGPTKARLRATNG